jgi:predicted GNAT superfamily acetyltransferase
MLGIDENYRSQKIGETLKQEQRDIAIEKGYDMMKWTFDPLETRNGYLNLTKIHGICDTYVENCYGEMPDGLNKGLPSDRFEIHWHLTSPHVTENKQPETKNPVAVNTISYNEANLPVFEAKDLADERTEPVYSLHVPKDFQALKAKDPVLALEWRLKTRTQFQTLFQAGYTAVQVEQHEDDAAYLFVKKDTLQLGGTDI